MDKKEAVRLAARACGVPEERIMAAAVHPDGCLAAVVWPGAKFRYPPEVVASLRASESHENTGSQAVRAGASTPSKKTGAGQLPVKNQPGRGRR